jgi:hypothetical protein
MLAAAEFDLCKSAVSQRLLLTNGSHPHTGAAQLEASGLNLILHHQEPFSCQSSSLILHDTRP